MSENGETVLPLLVRSTWDQTRCYVVRGCSTLSITPLRKLYIYLVRKTPVHPWNVGNNGHKVNEPLTKNKKFLVNGVIKW